MEGSATPDIVNTELSESDLLSVLADHGILSPYFSRIKSGRNSKVWKISSIKGRWILKQYHHHPDDPRDRLGTEFGFLSLLREHGVWNVPEPLACDLKSNWGLYSYLPGETVEKITTEHLSQVAEFVCRINNFRTADAAKDIPHASESCSSLKEHLQRIYNRLKLLKKIDEEGLVNESAKTFVNEKLIPTFLRLRDSIMSRYSKNILESFLEPDELILSPSDLGFHNILQVERRLYFIDFEYAGWDDPAKLFCDFTCQPEQPVTRGMAQVFLEQVCQELNLPGTERRTEILLPLYRLKWCCILMNEFCKIDRERREYASDQQNGILSVQLGKSQDYFNQHLRDI